MVTINRLRTQGDNAFLDVQHLFAGPCLGQNLVLGDDKPVSGCRSDDQFAPRRMHEQCHDVGFIRQIDHQAQRFTHAPTTGQVRRRDRVKPPVRSEHDNAIRRLGMNDKPPLIPVLELESGLRVDVPFHRADPPHLGTNNRDRFTVDHRLKRNLFGLARFGEQGAPRAAFKFFAKRLFGRAQLVRNAGPLN